MDLHGKGTRMTSVSELLGLPKFEGSQVLAGADGLGELVVDISIMEVPDIEDYVMPGDFLLTTLYPISARMDEFEEFIVRMKEAGLVGVGIKLNRYVTQIPDACLQRADEQSFPVVLLPTDANFSLMINDFLKVNLRKKNEELEHRNQVNEQVMKILLSGGAPAAIAQALSTKIDRSIILLDRTCEVLGSYSQAGQWEPIEEEVVECARRLRTRSDKVELSNGFCMLHGIRFGKKRIGVIAVCAPIDFEISGLDVVTLQQFAIVFRISVQHKEMAEDEQRNRRNSFAFDLLNGKIGAPDVAANRAVTLHWTLSYPLTMLVCAFPDATVETSSYQEAMTDLSKCVNRRVFGRSDERRVFWAVNGASLVALLCDLSEDTIGRVIRALGDALEGEGSCGAYIARSRNVDCLADIAAVYDECEYTLRLSQSLGNTGCTRFQDLGVFRLVYNAKSREALEAFCADTIGKLVDYDEKHSSNLLETIEAVADAGNNLKVAAERLFVHYNTVRYRYKLAQTLLEADFDCPEELQSVQLAIKVYRALPSLSQEKASASR